MKKIVIGLSGGLDSTTLLATLLEKGFEVHCCLFYYGSKHGELERKAAEEIIKYYQYQNALVIEHKFNIKNIFDGVGSALLLNDDKIPTGHYAAENMKSTVVPGRNLIFLSIMASIAENINAKYIGLGVHAGDHYIYPDCRPEFIKATMEAILKSTENKVSIITPFLNLPKSGILAEGMLLKLKVPYELTRTCYTSEKVACGKCGSCIERLEAFEINNIKDPIEYDFD